MTRRKTRRTTYQKRRTTRQKSSPVLWMLSGMMLGLIIAGFFYLKLSSNKQSLPDVQTLQLTAQTPEKPKKIHVKKTKAENGANYEFYNLLSSEEEQSQKTESQITQKCLLQAGVFDDFNRADQLKAQLTLLGVEEVTIKKSTQKNHLAYKVLIGPFTDPLHAAKIQKQLENNDILSKLIMD